MTSPQSSLSSHGRLYCRSPRRFSKPLLIPLRCSRRIVAFAVAIAIAPSRCCFCRRRRCCSVASCLSSSSLLPRRVVAFGATVVATPSHRPRHCRCLSLLCQVVASTEIVVVDITATVNSCYTPNNQPYLPCHCAVTLAAV